MGNNKRTAPAMGGFAGNPFSNFNLHKTRDGRYVVALISTTSKTDAKF
jgi:hypothetical protein